MSPHSTNGAVYKDMRRIALSYSNTDSESSALKLVFALYPEWQHEKGKVEFVPFTDGITNTLLKAVKRRPGYTEEQADEDAVLLRAYGKGTEVLIDRDRETISHSLLAQYQLAPPLLARFENGLIYEFIQGRVCESSDLGREQICRGIARKLGEWHGVLPITSVGEPNGVDHPNEAFASSVSLPKPTAAFKWIASHTPGKVVPNLWSVLQKWILALPTETEHERTRNDVLQKELARIVPEFGNLPGLGENGLVFGHCDLLSGNVIVHPDQSTKPGATSDVSFIDYEYATPVPAAFDIANHFAEWGGFECFYDVLPTRSQRREFISNYINSYCASREPPSSPEWSQSEVHQLKQRLFEDIDRFRGIPGFYWGIWALIQATISQIDFDYASYAERRLGEYWAWRAEQEGTRASQGEEMSIREKRWAEE